MEADKMRDQCFLSDGSSSYNKPNFRLNMATDIENVKTVIIPSVPDSKTAAYPDLYTKLNGSSTWVKKINNLSQGTNDLSSSPITFDQLKIDWRGNHKLAMCEIYMFNNKNYVPDSSISRCFQTYESQNVGTSSYSTNDKMYVVDSSTDSDFKSSSDHTCMYSQYYSSNIKSHTSILVFDFDSPLVITDLFLAGGSEEMEFHLVDPASEIMDRSACSIVNYLQTTEGGSTNDLNEYPDDAILEVAKMKQVDTDECTKDECEDWGITRMIVSNVNTDDFWLCGVAIMGYEVVCPPSAEQCVHARLQRLATGDIPSAMDIAVGGASTSDVFSFPDTLSVHCGQSSCSGTTHELLCTDCTTCDSIDFCSGNCDDEAEPIFTYAFTTSAADDTQYEVTVTDDGVLSINHECKIVATRYSQSQESYSTFKIKKSCALCPATEFTTTYVPTFTTVQIGSTGQTQEFTQFGDTVTECGSTCQEHYYTLLCHESTDLTETFVDVLGSDGWQYQIIGSDFTYEMSVVSQESSNHDKTWLCQLKAEQFDSGEVIYSTDIFEITFSLCVDPVEACAQQNYLVVPDPSGVVVPPPSFSVFLDGIAQSSSFYYGDWQDGLTEQCGLGFCGTLSYDYVTILSTKTVPITFSIPLTTVTITDSTAAQTLTISASTSDIAAVGVYSAYIHAKLVGANANDVAELYQCVFTITVTNPCTQSDACIYTNFVDPSTIMLQMDGYLDNVQTIQSYDPFDDTVSAICPSITCSGKSYSLVYSDTLIQVSSDLSFLTVGATSQVQLQTKNYLYTGVHNVKIQCMLTKTDGTVIYGYGMAFDLNIIACHEQSCIYTELFALVAPADTLPQSYIIGINNIAGTTTFSNYQNTVGSVCTSNSAICGTPVYKLVYSDNTEPTFTTLTSGVSIQTISAITNDLALAGDHDLTVEVTLDLPISLALSAIVMNSDEFTITIDTCIPLPCLYSTISIPTIASTVLPHEVFVYTNGTTSIDSWTPYRDDVSIRCSPLSGYADQCSAKNYEVTYPDGSPLPFAVSVSYNAVTMLWEMSVSTTDENLIETYQAIIHARFDTTSSLGTAADNSLYQFEIFIELPDPCQRLNCQRNQLILDRIGFVEPSNFTVDVSLNWNQTIYDNYNDSKHESCWKKPGSYNDGTVVASWDRPVCGFPDYQLVDADTLKPMTILFGNSNIDIEFYQDTEFTQQFIIAARTQDKQLDGDHHVMLGVKLVEEIDYDYTTPFWISVLDPCSPFDCSVTSFHPSSTKPTNIEISVGQGYVTSQQELWDNSVNELCGTSTPLCGNPTFELYLHDGSEVPFTYLVQTSASQILVNVIITDETMMGETFLVYLRGFGVDGGGQVFGTNGTSSIFEIIVSDEEAETPSFVVSEESLPIFTYFPQKIDYRKGASNDTVETNVQATSYSEYGIESMTVELGAALSFITYVIDNNIVYFTIQMSDSIKVGLYTIEVEAMDVNGVTVTQSFVITIFEVQESTNTEPDVIEVNSDETLEPLRASIQNIGLSGLITIGYNRRVIPVTNPAWITSNEFRVTFEQRSYEVDQTADFRYEVIGMTPQNIYVQMTFKTPLDVSQGLQPDLVHIEMLRGLFMVEDLQGIYKGWVKGDKIEQVEVDVEALRKQINYGNFANTTLYEPLTGIVPKQVADEAELRELLNQVKISGDILQTLLWGPLAMHLIGFGSMEYVWIIFSNLQLISCLSQFDLKLPLNMIVFTESYSDLANANILPLTQIYQWLKYQSSDSDDPSVSIYGTKNIDLTGNLSQNLINGGDGRLLTQLEDLSEFEQSRFFAKGASERVLETSAQMILLILALNFIALSGIVLQKSILYMFPARLQKLFHWLRMRIFWCFPMRMMIQNYMCITFASFLNIKYQNSSDSTEQRVNFAFSVCLIIFYSIGFIVFIYKFTRKYHGVLKRSEMIRRFDSIYISLELEKKWALPQVGFSLLRKFLLIFVAVVVEINLLQFCVALYIQEFYTCYIVLIKPMNRPSRQLNEYFNEVMICIVIMLLCLFTDYIPDAGIRYSTGTIIIMLVCLQTVVNTVFLMIDVTQNLRKIYKIFKYKYVMHNRVIEVTVHNTVLDNVDRHKNSQQFETYKKRNPLLQSQLDVIDSVGSVPSSSMASVDLDSLNSSVKVIKTISARKKEFEQMMEEMKAQHPETQLLTQENGQSQVRNPQMQHEALLMLQKDNEWPLSPRDVRNINLPDIDNKWKWNNDLSKASDWNALPADFQSSGMISVSLFSSDRSRYPLQSDQNPKKSQIIGKQKDQLDYSVPDANLNSKEHSKWKEDDSFIFGESKNDIVSNNLKVGEEKLKVVQESNDEISWDFR